MPTKPLILHAHSSGPNPFKAAIVMEMLQVPYEVHVWEFGDDPKNGVKGAAYLAINENGRLPTLQDPNTGVISWESAAVVSYLLRIYDKEAKLGPGPSEQEKVDFDKWTSFLISTLAPFTGQVSWYRNDNKTKNEDALNRYVAQTYRSYDVLEGQLKKAGSGYVLPHGFTAVDAHFYPWVDDYKPVGLSLDNHPKIKAWYEQIGEKAEVKSAYKKIKSGKRM